MIGPTRKQLEIMRFIEDFLLGNGIPPSIRDIAENFKISDPTAFEHLNALQKKGLISRSSKARSITINVGNLSRKSRPRIVFAPLLASDLGRSQQKDERVIPLDAEYFGLANDYNVVCVQAPDSSLEKFGISKGDLIILRPLTAEGASAHVLTRDSNGKLSLKKHGDSQPGGAIIGIPCGLLRRGTLKIS